MGHREDHRRSPGVEGPTVVSVLPSLTVFFPASHSLGIPASMLCKAHLRQSGLGEGALAGEEPAPSHCDRRKQVPSSSPAGILNPNHRTRASASHSTPHPKLLRCLQGKGGGGQPRPPPHGQSGGLEPVIVSDPEWPAFFPHEHPGIILPQQNTKTPATT